MSFDTGEKLMKSSRLSAQEVWARCIARPRVGRTGRRDVLGYWTGRTRGDYGSSEDVRDTNCRPPVASTI